MAVCMYVCIYIYTYVYVCVVLSVLHPCRGWTSPHNISICEWKKQICSWCLHTKITTQYSKHIMDSKQILKEIECCKSWSEQSQPAAKIFQTIGSSPFPQFHVEISSYRSSEVTQHCARGEGAVPIPVSGIKVKAVRSCPFSLSLRLTRLCSLML